MYRGHLGLGTYLHHAVDYAGRTRPLLRMQIREGVSGHSE